MPHTPCACALYTALENHDERMHRSRTVSKSATVRRVIIPTAETFRLGRPKSAADSTIAIPKRHVAHIPGNVRRRSRHQADDRSLLSQARAHLRRFALDKADETKYFEPATWFFWRGIIMYFFVFSVVGHWMELPYCLSMHGLFGIVEAGYAIWSDPFYVPYWVYGIGAAAVTLLLLPLKIKIVGQCKTAWGAALRFLVTAVVLCAALECIIGLVINQPNELGEYPFWDNSVLPLNILDQAWLVNDFFLGLVALAYVWLVFPFCQKFMSLIGNRAANRVFVCVLALFAVICVVSYA